MRITIGRAAAAVALLVMSVGCGLVRGRDEPAPVAVEASPEPVTVIETVAPEPEPSEPSEAPTKKPKAPKATPLQDPNNFTLPDCANREGKMVSRKTAGKALNAAATRTYWKTEAPQIKISADLIRSVAWQESGWQSNIVNCDGGRGLMQVMPDTVAQMNLRFGLDYNAKDYKQNATVGANYLAWLTKAFGDDYFKGKYDLSPKKCKTHGSMCLLNMVISGYHVGRGGVDAAYASKEFSNADYVDSVRSLMKSCYCDRY